MMKIPYATRSKFLTPISTALAKQVQAEDCEITFEISLPPSGYEADIVVELLPSDSQYFRADSSISDPTRFPSRVKAAATALRDARRFGKFRIQHSSGHLAISQTHLSLPSIQHRKRKLAVTADVPTSSIVDQLTRAKNLLHFNAVMAGRTPILADSGVYAWYFKNLSNVVPTSNTVQVNGFQLLYLGISPSRETSGNTLRQRIRGHFTGNAEGSTLRLSLGCLLASELGIELVRIGKSTHFGDGETRLTEWMADNARVAVAAHPAPWQVEGLLINEFDLPLNLEHNTSHPFHKTLSQLRSTSRKNAYIVR